MSRVGPFYQKRESDKSRYLMLYLWVPKFIIPSFSLVASAKKLEAASKVYIVGYTNKTGDLEAVFEISYF